MTSSGWALWSVEAGEQLPEQADLVFDLGVGAAESGGGVRAAQHPGNEGHQLCLVGSLVREQLGLKLVEQRLNGAEVNGLGG